MIKLNLRSVLPALIGAVVLVLFDFLPDTARDILIFDRRDIAQGEIWRLVTANLLHTNFMHVLLNSVGLFVAVLTFYDTWPKKYWAFCLVICAIGSLSGLYWFHPDVVRYVGLSGCLHGLFIFGAVGLIKVDKWLGALFTTGILAKVAWENTFGAPEQVSKLINARVVVESHLWGTVFGLVLAIVLFKTLASKNIPPIED